MDQHVLHPHLCPESRPEERPEGVLPVVPAEDQPHPCAPHRAQDVRGGLVDGLQHGVVAELLSRPRHRQHAPGPEELARPRRGEARQRQQAEGRGQHDREAAPAFEGNTDERSGENEQRQVQPAVPRLPLQSRAEHDRARDRHPGPQSHRRSKRLAPAPDNHNDRQTGQEMKRVADEVLVEPERSHAELGPERGADVVRVEAHRAMG